MELWPRCSGGCPRWPGWPGSAPSSPGTALFLAWYGEVQALRAGASPGRAGVVTEEMLADLPGPVRRYLGYTGVVGKAFPGTVRLGQKGQMRLGPGLPWIPVFDEQGRLTDFVARRYRTASASSPEIWSTPVTGYGEFEGLRLPARGKAIYKLPGGDFDYIEVTVTDLHYDTAAPQRGGPDERAGLRSQQIRGDERDRPGGRRCADRKGP